MIIQLFKTGRQTVSIDYGANRRFFDIICKIQSRFRGGELGMLHGNTGMAPSKQNLSMPLVAHISLGCNRATRDNGQRRHHKNNV